MVTKALAAALLLIACTACGRSPLSPAASTIQTATVSVRVLAYNDQISPISSAHVTVDGGAPVAVDASGVAVVTVPIGVDVTIEASADGYASLAAVGTVETLEHWTFWLERP